MGQYVGKYQGENVYYCGGANETLTDMQFFYNDDDKAFFNFEHVLLNGSTTAISLWGYFSDVVIYKNEKPVIEPAGIESLTPALSQGEGARYNLRGQKVDSQLQGHRHPERQEISETSVGTEWTLQGEISCFRLNGEYKSGYKSLYYYNSDGANSSDYLITPKLSAGTITFYVKKPSNASSPRVYVYKCSKKWKWIYSSYRSR